MGCMEYTCRHDIDQWHGHAQRSNDQKLKTKWPWSKIRWSSPKNVHGHLVFGYSFLVFGHGHLVFGFGHVIDQCHVQNCITSQI